MSTSLSSLNTSILPLCLQNKTKPLQENPLLSGPHPPVCLIRLYLLINPPTCSTLRSRSQRNQGLLLFCLQAFRQVVLSQTLFFHLIPTHPPVQTSSYQKGLPGPLGTAPICPQIDLFPIRATSGWTLWKTVRLLRSHGL